MRAYRSFGAAISLFTAALALAACTDGGANQPFDVAPEVLRRRTTPLPEGGTGDDVTMSDASDVVSDMGMPPTDVPTDRPAPTEGGDVMISMDAMDVMEEPPPPAEVRVRVANMLLITAAGPPPAIDICLRRAGSSSMMFEGPTLENRMLPAGVPWQRVTAYQTIPAGRYDVAVISASATNCDTPIFGIRPDLDFSTPNAHYTLVFAGPPVDMDAGIPIGVRATVVRDRDPATAAMSPSALRLFNAIVVPGVPMQPRFDVGLVTDPMMPAESFLPIFGGVALGELGGPAMGLESAFDMLRYYTATATGSMALTVGARPTGSTGALSATISGLMIRPNTFTLAFLTIVLPAGTTMPRPGAVMCIDNAPPIMGYSQCAAP